VLAFDHFQLVKLFLREYQEPSVDEACKAELIEFVERLAGAELFEPLNVEGIGHALFLPCRRNDRQITA
jgi:hypothetical protein